MSTDFAMYLCKQLLNQALLVLSPLILVVMICGLVISILQAVTQIQDSTLSFVPKILATVVMLTLVGEWMLNSLITFSAGLIQNIPANLS